MHSSSKSRGVLGVLANLFLGGYLGLSENLGGPLFLPFGVLLDFHVTISWTLPHPAPLVCIYAKALYFSNYENLMSSKEETFGMKLQKLYGTLGKEVCLSAS